MQICLPRKGSATTNNFLKALEIEEDKLNEMIEWYGTVEEWVSDVKAELGI